MSHEEITERLMQAQAELQIALGFHRLNMCHPEFKQPPGVGDDAYIEMRMRACLSMIHSLMGELGRPMFSPTKMPEGWTPA